MTKRFVGKVSGDSSVDELINLIAKLTGLDPTEIQLSDEFLSNFKLLQEQKLKIKEMINPFYDEFRSLNTKDSKKKINELIDLGKFLVYSKLDSDAKIIECGEQPDFLIKHFDNVIGVEHTTIYDDEIVAAIRTIKKTIEKCQKKLATERGELTGLYNLIVSPKEFMKEFKLSENKTIDKICDHIIAIHGNADTESPGFISETIYLTDVTLQLTLAEKYDLADLTPEAISETISKKEDKVDPYKQLKNIKECWLLVVIEGASSDSSFKLSLQKLPTHLTRFDKVFIFDNFKGQITEGKKTGE